MAKPLNESTIRYKLYEAALETGITSAQYQELMSEGLGDWVKDALAGVAGGKALAGKLSSLFKDEKNKAIYTKATETVKKTVEELFRVGEKAGIDKTALKDWLVAGISKIAETAASEGSASPQGASPATSDKPVPAGQVIRPNDATTAIPVLATAAAQAAAQDPAHVRSQAKEKGADVPKATSVLAKAIAQKANVDVGLTSKVISWLLQNKHMVAESGSRVTGKDLLTAARSASGDKAAVERWHQLAGMLNEEVAPSSSSAKKFGNFLDDLQAALHIKDDDAEPLMNILIALDDLDALELK